MNLDAMARSAFLWLGISLTLGLAAPTLVLAFEDPPKAVPSDHAAAMARGLDLFKGEVRGLLVDHCLKCHGGAATKGDFDLSNRESLLKDGGEGPAVIPGKAAQSRLYRMVAHLDKPVMPAKAAKLPDLAIQKIGAWIDAGAPYDRSLVDASKPGPLHAVVTEADRRFWSFRPLGETPVPPGPERSPIDRFLKAKREAVGIKANPTADRRTLIRRASFDLTGLPPSPGAVEAFVNDPSPEAFARVVDRLLASPSHGERWARHWLDLARFAESHGYEHDYDRPTAYHYRDFVIRALNEDMPYDRFIKLQVAGDEFEPTNPQALMATGFLASGVHSTQITANTAEKERYDEMDDMAATLGTSMLALTVGCARCHDHKFDPIPTADYYKLIATFTTTVRGERDFELDPAKTQADRQAHQVELARLTDARTRFERDELPARYETWLQSHPQPPRPAWRTLTASAFTSQAGATFTRKDDGSYLATGPNPEADVYTFETRVPSPQKLTSIRLDALADPSMVRGGPGRAANGNFALSDIKVTASPMDGGPSIPVKLVRPRATFEQKGLPIAASLDDDPHSAWAIDPKFGKDQSAAFDLDPPVGFEGGTALTVTMAFACNTGHTIGRPRLSVSTEPGPVAIDGDCRSLEETASLEAALNTPRIDRTPEQNDQLRALFRATHPVYRALDQTIRDHQARAPGPTLTKVLVASEGIPALRLHTQGADFFEKTYLLKRGDLAQKQGETKSGFLQVMTSTSEDHWNTPTPAGSKLSYRRTALANWMTDVDAGAGRLLARVIVNRLWQHHFGRGIVATPSDFGTQGDRPTHPELLDFLAAELIRQGWKLKPIHRLIMLSDAYQQASTFDESKARADPDNLLQWRHAPARLEAEAIRDAMLAVSGTLDARMFGPGTLDESMTRRSLYFTVKRSHLIPILTLFDAPDALQGLGQRSATTVAPQALALLNNPQIRRYAQAFAHRVHPDKTKPISEAIDQAYRLALSRPPALEERQGSLEFLEAQANAYRRDGHADAEQAALADFCQALMSLNEFVYVE